MSGIPTSYKDPYWAKLASAAESRLEIPSGLLKGILIRGERSNADQVSEAGARTPFQITPSTRQAALDQYGIDAYLSPENAAEVAGRLLKDSLQRNGGSAAVAVAEYHGGTDRNNWGPKTRAYVSRVMSGMSNDTKPAAAEQGGQSTFQRALQQQQANQPNPDAIAQIYEAYKTGKMTPQDATEFEADVKAGYLMLPHGATLNGEKARSPLAIPEPVLLPQGVTDAYTQGRMTEEDRLQLEQDMRAGLVKLPPSRVSQIPTDDPNWKPPTEQQIITRAPEPSIVDRVKGAGEAALSTATGITGGAAGMFLGTVNQTAKNILDGTFGTPEALRLVEQAAIQGAQDLTYEPRTETGRDYTEAVGSAMQQVLPVAPMLGELGALSAGVRQATPAIATAGRAVVAPVKSAAQATGNAIAAPVRAASDAVGGLIGREKTQAPTGGTGASVGASGTDMAAMRRASAEEIGFTGDSALTEGQATRDFAQQQFERESAKLPELGDPLRERFANQNAKAQQVVENWLDDTGATAPDNRAVGVAVDDVLRKQMGADKNRIRVAYKEAEKAGEMESPVETSGIIDVLNNSASAESTAPVLTAAKKELVRLGGATLDDAGNLVASDITLANMEQLRKFINKVTGADPTNIKFASDLKRAIDAATEGKGGELYAKARALRVKFAQKYENHAVISDLLNMKRGTEDRRVALENVFDRIVLNGSLDDLRTAGRTIKTSGSMEEGSQAWKEVQGATIRYLREQATKNVQRDINGREVFSPAGFDRALNNLDSSGKLDYLFGKRGAEQLRTLNDVSKTIFTSPPGSVNTSNTASVLLAAMDMAIIGAGGMPLPVLSGLRMLTKNMKDRQLKSRINYALGVKTRSKQNAVTRTRPAAVLH